MFLSEAFGADNFKLSRSSCVKGVTLLLNDKAISIWPPEQSGPLAPPL